MKEKLELRDIMKISSISSGLVLIFSIIVLVSGKVFVELQKMPTTPHCFTEKTLCTLLSIYVYILLLCRC